MAQTKVEWSNRGGIFGNTNCSSLLGFELLEQTDAKVNSIWGKNQMFAHLIVRYLMLLTAINSVSTVQRLFLFRRRDEHDISRLYKPKQVNNSV